MFIYHKRVSLHLFISICTLHNSPLHCTFSLEKVTTFLKATPHELVEQKKYDASSITTLHIKNISGSITIVTKSSPDPLQATIFMEATKKARTEELCQEITISSSIDESTLRIITNDSAANRAGTIDYNLIVPTTLTLILETETGAIDTDNTHGALTATTTKGTIHCSNTHHTITTHIKESGSITIEQAYKPIYATSKKGTISIHDAADTITAYVHKGKITAHSAALPHNRCIHLKTDTGPITLHTPATVHASVNAHTTHGTVTCDHLITLLPHKTRLNAHAWNNFKKEVHGVLGTTAQPSSSIVLSSLNGNIKILDSITG